MRHKAKHKRHIGRFCWSFVRFEALVPERIQDDTFVWFYLSLVVLVNKENQRPEDSYSTDTAEEVYDIILNQFRTIIDKSILSRIIGYVERDHLILDTTQAGNARCLRPESLDSLDSYRELFSEKTCLRHIFRDTLTGAVVPCFDIDPSRLKTEKSDKIPANKQFMTPPSKSKVERAIKSYERSKNTKFSFSETPINSNIFYDPNATVDFDPDDEDELFDSQPDNPVIDFEFNVVYLNEIGECYDLPIDVYLENNKIVVDSPFANEEATRSWLNQRFDYAKKSGLCKELSQLVNSWEEEYLISPLEIEKADQIINSVPANSVADRLKQFGRVYRLVETTTNEDLKALTQLMEQFFSSRSHVYFNVLGNFLECLIVPLFKRFPSKKNYTFWTLTQTLRGKSVALNVDFRRLIESEHVFNDWMANRHSGFKAKILDIVLREPGLTKCQVLYQNFITELFELYDKRNNGTWTHYKPGMLRKKPFFDPQDAEKVYNVTRVLVDIYEN